MKPLIHFAHGNGFPSSCYQQLFKYLKPNFELTYINQVGHNPEFPLTDNWHELVNEVIANIENMADRKVIGVGHSLGGVLTFRASIARPDLFEKIILLDSPIIGPIKSKILRFVKALGLIDKFTPAQRTKFRRQHWPDKPTAYDYFKSKKIFTTFTKQCLQDYIDYGLMPTSEGYVLKFDRSIEYQIYRSIPHDLPNYTKHITVPTYLLYGEQSNVVKPYDRYVMEKLTPIQCIAVPGTHMFPFEVPEHLACTIDDCVNSAM